MTAAGMPARVLTVEALNERPAARALVVTPSYNERDNVAALLEAVGRTGADFMLVDDASPDGTAEALRAGAGDAKMRVWLMRRSGKHGLGTAYVDAFRWMLARGPAYDVIVSMDADFSHDPGKVPALVEAARRAGFAIGSRYVAGGSCPDWPLARRLLSRWANWYAKTIIGLRYRGFRVHDATAGFVAWRRDVLERVLAADPKSNGYAFLIETKLAAVMAGHVPEEIPIAFIDRRHGVSKISKKVILESAFLPWKLLFGKK